MRTDRTLLMNGYVFRWQNLVTRAEERHKLVTASLNFYKTAEQVSLNLRWTCDLYGPVGNVYDACRSITRASGRGPNLDFFGT